MAAGEALDREFHRPRRASNDRPCSLLDPSHLRNGRDGFDGGARAPPKSNVGPHARILANIVRQGHRAGQLVVDDRLADMPDTSTRLRGTISARKRRVQGGDRRTFDLHGSAAAWHANPRRRTAIGRKV